MAESYHKKLGQQTGRIFMRRLIVSNSGQSDIAVQRFTGANRKGIYESKFIMRLEMKEGKLNYIKGMIEPIRMLKAAGLRVPGFP